MLRRPKVQIKPVLKKLPVSKSTPSQNVGPNKLVTPQLAHVSETIVLLETQIINEEKNEFIENCLNVDEDRINENQIINEKGDEEILTKLKELTENRDVTIDTTITTVVQIANDNYDENENINQLNYSESLVVNKEASIKTTTTTTTVVDHLRKVSTVKSPQKVNKVKEKRKRTPRSKTLSFLEGKIDRQKVTIFDLLSYNPPPTKQQLQKQKEQQMSNESSEQNSVNINHNTTEISSLKDTGINEMEDEEEEEEEEVGPRVKVGANGELILDEESCVIKRKKKETESNGLTIIESNQQILNSTNYSSFRRQDKRSSRNKWSEEETVQFYTALSLIGTDFTLMSNLFFKGKRSRTDLRNKYKKEERERRALIDKTLTSSDLTDLSRLEEIDQLLSIDNYSDSEETDKSKANKNQSKKDKANKKLKSKQLKDTTNNEDMINSAAIDNIDEEVTDKSDDKINDIDLNEFDMNEDDYMDDEEFKPSYKLKINDDKHYTRSQDK